MRESDPVRAIGYGLVAVIVSLVAILVIALMLQAWVVTAAYAHSWYEVECCDTRDCEPLAPDRVTLTKEGYLLPNGVLVRYGEERPSRDYDYHWCRNLGTKQIITPGGRPICFFAPPAGG